MKVMDTDYNHFATVLFRMILNNTEVFIVFIFGESLLHPLRGLVMGPIQCSPNSQESEQFSSSSFQFKRGFPHI